ncbi:MAG: zinc-ribbon domain-containing protein [Promethearchaeota archaeon]
MFCPNCGKKVDMSNQKFCPNCGNELPTIYETPQAIPSRQPALGSPKVQFRDQKQVQAKGPYSKRSLGFGIASLIIAMTALNIGSTFLMSPVFKYRYFVSVVFLGLTIMHIIGLIFGIISNISSQQAKNVESINSALKAGSVLSVIGIILNSILMIAALLIVTFIL